MMPALSENCHQIQISSHKTGSNVTTTTTAATKTTMMIMIMNVTNLLTPPNKRTHIAMQERKRERGEERESPVSERRNMAVSLNS